MKQPGAPTDEPAPTGVYGGVALLPPILSVDRVADYLGVTAHAVRGMLRRRQLPGARIGKRWIVRGGALIEHLRRLERAR